MLYLAERTPALDAVCGWMPRFIRKSIATASSGVKWVVVGSFQLYFFTGWLRLYFVTLLEMMNLKPQL